MTTPTGAYGGRDGLLLTQHRVGSGSCLLPICVVRSEMYLHSLKEDTILNPVMSLPEMYPKRHGCTQIPVSMYPVEDDTRERGKQEAA